MTFDVTKAGNFFNKLESLYTEINKDPALKGKFINDKLEVVGKVGFFGKLKFVILKIVSFGFYDSLSHVRVNNVVNKMFKDFTESAPLFKVVDSSNTSKQNFDYSADYTNKFNAIMNTLSQKTNKKHEETIEFARDGVNHIHSAKTKILAQNVKFDNKINKASKKKVLIEKQDHERKIANTGVVNAGINLVNNIVGGGLSLIFGSNDGKKFAPQGKINAQGVGSK